MISGFSPPPENDGAAIEGEVSAFERFQCCVCLDLLYKPIVLEEETRHGFFSPELSDKSICDQIDPGQNKPIVYEENKCACNGKDNGCLPLKESSLPISVIDVLCCACKEILVRPAVLNCGHVYCEFCISRLTNISPRCQVCEMLHP